jgi:hypothetical protein
MADRYITVIPISGRATCAANAGATVADNETGRADPRISGARMRDE